MSPYPQQRCGNGRRVAGTQALATMLVAHLVALLAVPVTIAAPPSIVARGDSLTIIADNTISMVTPTLLLGAG